MIGLCSVTFRDKSPEEIIMLANNAGLEAIEWGSDSHVPETNIDNAKRIASLMTDTGLKTSSYGSYYTLGSDIDFEPFINIATILGAKTIRVWAGEVSSAETSETKRDSIIKNAKRVGQLARSKNIAIGIEYHQKTLTDTPESALQLMLEIQDDNVYLYWQPAESLSVKERKLSLPKLAPWITNIHVFNWENYMNRFPLSDAKDDWTNYVDLIEENSTNEHHYLLEFVPDKDQIRGFKESVETLKELVK